jgi:hypothetical protein
MRNRANQPGFLLLSAFGFLLSGFGFRASAFGLSSIDHIWFQEDVEFFFGGR